MSFVERTITIAAADPTLPGHFPGAPVVPGALLMQSVLDAVADRNPTGLRQVKFLAPALPDQTITLTIDEPRDRRCRFTFTHGGTTVATGIVTLGDRP